MVTIIFNRNGYSISDFSIREVADNVQELCNHDITQTMEISTHLLIDELRARIRERKISLNNIRFMIETEDGILHHKIIDKSGRSNTWFIEEEVQDSILDRLL